jgi:hypothetical protein
MVVLFQAPVFPKSRLLDKCGFDAKTFGKHTFMPLPADNKAEFWRMLAS